MNRKLRIGIYVVCGIIIVVMIAMIAVANIHKVSDMIYGKNVLDPSWKNCESDSDCVFVKSPSVCGCQYSINTEHEEEYEDYYKRSVKKRNLENRFIKYDLYCEMCPDILDSPNCERGMCVP